MFCYQCKISEFECIQTTCCIIMLFLLHPLLCQISNLNAIECGLLLLLPFLSKQYLFCPFSIQVIVSLRLCDSYFIPTNFRLLNRTFYVEVAHETHESLSNDSLIKTTIIYCALKMQHGLGQHSILEKVSKYVDLDIYQTFLQGIFVLWSATSCVKNEGRSAYFEWLLQLTVVDALARYRTQDTKYHSALFTRVFKSCEFWSKTIPDTVKMNLSIVT
ncbi:unnamed protein product [Albugo candida]|uniref:Uncharacterized protein n=1 Tax=Albugo candida TaxID=65357 RepID=A0A024GRT8_9STRA|nr:unnamed protein product [Albugo candida]|eukprot:CCI49635.1 unnamed protein product [Albugo candida]